MTTPNPQESSPGFEEVVIAAFAEYSTRLDLKIIDGTPPTQKPLAEILAAHAAAVQEAKREWEAEQEEPWKYKDAMKEKKRQEQQLEEETTS